MTNSPQNLLRLMTILSPSFPVGAFSYSSGLAAAFEGDAVDDIQEWLAVSLEAGTLHNDALLCALTYRTGATFSTNRMALALAGGKERYDETTALGDSFRQAVQPYGIDFMEEDDIAYPVAVGYAAFKMELDEYPTLVAYMQAGISNLVQVALRLGKIGQSAGTALMAALEPQIAEHATFMLDMTEDALGISGFKADIYSLRHEQQISRMFQS